VAPTLHRNADISFFFCFLFLFLATFFFFKQCPSYMWDDPQQTIATTRRRLVSTTLKLSPKAMANPSTDGDCSAYDRYNPAPHTQTPLVALHSNLITVWPRPVNYRGTPWNTFRIYLTNQAWIIREGEFPAKKKQVPSACNHETLVSSTSVCWRKYCPITNATSQFIRFGKMATLSLPHLLAVGKLAASQRTTYRSI
jgi:hypothetical protein